jgi:cyanophycin synthetase
MIEIAHPTQPSMITETDKSSFVRWRAKHTATQALPIIGVTGSRGKTIVVQLLDAIFSEAGLRTATRTDSSVEIRGKRQKGEIAPWQNVKEELAGGTLDVAIEEIDWVTIQSMGIKAETYPTFVVSNICGNRDACLIQGDARRAVAALPIVFEATSRHGDVILPGDEIIVSREESLHDRASTYVGLNRESPGLRAHLDRRLRSAWVEHGNLMVGRIDDAAAICRVDELRFTLNGRAGFQVQNALLAAATALAVGISASDVRRALVQFQSDVKRMPTTFRTAEVDGITVVLDRPNPSWFLRPIIRSLRDIGPARIITVVGKISDLPETDLQEVGRLLGRASAVLVMNGGDDDANLTSSIKHGAALNNVPPMIIHVKSETRALARAMAMARRGDIVFALSDHLESLTRLLNRRRLSLARERTVAAFF